MAYMIQRVPRVPTHDELSIRIEDARHAVEEISLAPNLNEAFKNAFHLMVERLEEYDSTESKLFALLNLEETLKAYRLHIAS